MLNLITINECINIVKINTKANNNKCIILTNKAYAMLTLITNNVCIYKCKRIKFVNINTNTNNHTCIILSNWAYTMYTYSLHTARHIVLKLRWIPQSSLCSSDEVFLRWNRKWGSVTATKWPATKHPRNEITGDEVYPQWNCWRPSVSTTKRQWQNGSEKNILLCWTHLNHSLLCGTPLTQTVPHHVAQASSIPRRWANQLNSYRYLHPYGRSIWYT